MIGGPFDSLGVGIEEEIQIGRFVCFKQMFTLDDVSNQAGKVQKLGYVLLVEVGIEPDDAGWLEAEIQKS